MTVSFPSTRPLIYNRLGSVKACVLVHHPDGLRITGSLMPATPDDALRAASAFPELDTELVAARAKAAADMVGADPVALAARTWQLDLDTDPYHVRPLVEPAPLSHWVSSRIVFATLGEQARVAHVSGHLYGADALYATHLGYTSTVVTADGFLVCVRRTAKLLADGLHDSAIGDTALLADMSGGEWDLRDAIVAAGRKFLGLDESDYTSVLPSLVAVRTDDAGLWVAAHSHINLDRDQLLDAVSERSQFPDPGRCSFLAWNEDAPAAAQQLGDWTSWGVADLASAASIDFGPPLQEWVYPSLP